ncbi:DUF1796 family putative cysteine peptidase [Bacillus mesophilum]|uniref:Peptidase n=1 Tax=Bacillus mesophilum TaxID=1071718 RepID=A0A7V7RRU0_9BACI|nr:DUF1796 family putative cysteine peptidase [Bacillus mesophilum]KAB2335692.1 peptidase [Bacillus mesophilum]
MRFQQIKGEYDAAFSLGHLCLASMQLRKFQLRPFSGVLDWVGSPNLSNINSLISNDFKDFLNFQHLQPVKYLSSTDLYVWDSYYDIGFNHDFKTDQNSLEQLGGYDTVKEKYDRRIARFNEKLETGKRILFIRTEGNKEEIEVLQQILAQKCSGDFELLVVNHQPVQSMSEHFWNIPNVTVAEMPNDEIWDGNDAYWAELFDGVTLG